VLFAVPAASAQPAQSKTYTIQSKILGEERRIRVALPANYNIARQRYPVVYLLDGHVQAFFNMAVAAVSYDITGDPHDFAIPPQIVVAIEHKNRGVDLGQNADLFMRYLVEEVGPFLDKQFRTLRYRILVGHSLGGRFALMAPCRAPRHFAALVAVSPGGGDSTSYRAMTNCLRNEWTDSFGVFRQVFVSSGERETRIDEGAKRLRDFLRDSAPRFVRWSYLDGPGLAHTETPFFGIPAGIKFIWDRSVWELPAARADSVLNAKGDAGGIVERWYNELSARTGVPIPPSPKWLELASAAQQREGDTEASERSARQLVKDYPEYLSGYGRLTDVLVAKRDYAEARKVLQEAVRICDKLDFFDETERALKRKVLTDGLARLPGAN
jgi:predicted alpha/beta superfamily hydrolase